MPGPIMETPASSREKTTSGGELLRMLRHRSTPKTTYGRRKRRLSQEDVEVQAGIGDRNLSKYERGGLPANRKTVNNILDAIDKLSVEGIKFTERKQVLEAFGFIASRPLPKESEVQWALSVTRPVLDRVTVPAYVLDCAQRPCAWNHYMPTFFGADPHGPVMRIFGSMPIFQLFFDRRFRLVDHVINPERFVPAFLGAVYHEFLPYRNEAWCRQLIAETRRRYPEFARHWQAVEDMHSKQTILSEISARPLVPVAVQAPPHSEMAGDGPLLFRVVSESLIRDERFRVIYLLPADVSTMQAIERFAKKPPAPQ